MIIKEISTKTNDYFIRDTKKEYKTLNNFQKNIYKTFDDYNKSMIDYLQINKKYGFLDFEIIEK